jgi:DNA repair photolyase
MITTERKGGFIKQFSGPGENTIICFKFWQAVVASGCPGECSYCFLQTQYPYRSGAYGIKGTLFTNLREIVDEARAWLQQPIPAGLIIGENQDGLAFEKPYKRLLDVTPLELLIPLFDKENPTGHVLIILSKFIATDYAEAFGPSPNVIFSWSLSLPTISEAYERKVSPLNARLEKAARMKGEGYRIRFRLDALAPIPGWEEELSQVMARINEVGPEMLTIGALRATKPAALRRAAERNGRDGSIFNYISTVDPSGFKYRTEHDFHVSIFRQIKEQLAPGITLGLCKEDSSMWNETEIRWTGCHCLHGSQDVIVEKRFQITRRKEEERPAVLFQ